MLNVNTKTVVALFNINHKSVQTSNTFSNLPVCSISLLSTLIFKLSVSAFCPYLKLSFTKKTPDMLS